MAQPTRTLFTALDIPHENNEAYIKLQKILRGLKVVDDAAELGVELIEQWFPTFFLLGATSILS